MIKIELILGVVLIFLFVSLLVVRRIFAKRKAERMREQEIINSAKNELKETEVTLPQELTTAIEKETTVESKPETIVKTDLKIKKDLGQYKNLPEDSMLRRHYLTHLRSIDEAIHEPRPTDSTLKRHYDTMIEKELEQCLCDPAALENLKCSYNAQKQHTARGKAKKQIHAAVEKAKKAFKIPEDSMLRRHYLTHIRLMIEAQHGSPHPTDSTLKRHYETMIENEVEAYLETEVD